MSEALAALVEITNKILRLLRGLPSIFASGLSITISYFGAAFVRSLSPASSIAIWIPRLIRFAFVSSKVGVFVAPFAVITFLAITAIANPYMKADLDYAHERSSAAEIVDRDGRWLGIIPPANFSDWSDGSILPPDQAAIPIVDIPPVWRSCVVFLEDRDFDGISRWFGVDPIAVLKAGWQTITFQRRRGASTLYMQIVRMLYGRSPNQKESPGEVAIRKLAEILGASALVSMFDESDPRAAARFVGMHLPLVIGASKSTFGEPLYGIELASRTLFGGPAISLPPEAQAILAAAIKAPILMAPPGDTKGADLARKRWERVKERSDYCLRYAFPDRENEMEAARRRLAALDLPQPAIDVSMAKLLPRDARAAWKIAVNPTRRALFFARQEMASMMPELEQAVGKDWRGRVLSIRLTTSATESRLFSDNVVNTLRRLQTTVPGLDWNLTSNESASEAADVVVACADSGGRVRNIYSSRQGLFWNRKAPVGSVAKMVAAVALGRVDNPSTPYCPAPISGIASSEGGDPEICHHKDAWLSAKEAFARSNNKAIHWALRRVERKTLETVAAGFGLPSFGDTPPATALTIGTFELTPREMLRVASTIGEGLTGSTRNVYGVKIIDQIIVIDRRGQSTLEAVPEAEVVTDLNLRGMFSPRVKSFVGTVLQATSDSNGTLKSLRWLKDQLHGQLYAKTGTVSVQGSTQDLHIAGTYIRNGKPWSFVVTVGTPSNNRPLGRHLAAGKFASLAAIAVCRSLSSNIEMTQAQ